MLAAAVGTGVGVLFVIASRQVMDSARLGASVLCVLGALIVVVLGMRRRLAEIAIMGCALLIAPTLHVVAAVTSPAGVVAAADVSRVATALATPLAGLCGLPLVLPDHPLRSVVARHWRPWIGLSIAAALTPFAALSTLDLPSPVPSPAVVTTCAFAGAVVFVGVGRRQLALYRVGRQRQSLIVAVAMLAMAVTGPLATVAEVPRFLSTLVVVTDVTLSAVAISGLALVVWRTEQVPDIMAPLSNRDPLVALRLGMDPVAAEFVRQIAEKDAGTREHVVRVGELAMRLAIRSGVRGRRLRALGIGALLHDLGKLEVPDDVLRKPGALTDDEYELVKRHPEAGARLLQASPLLDEAAQYVRWHHERPDGSGYPDGLTADEIPQGVAILSVCDAFDAMTQDRHYRRAMTVEQAFAIIDQHAGTQFDETAVRLLRAELEADPTFAGVFRTVGDEAGRSSRVVTDDATTDNAPARGFACGHALPAGLASRTSV